MMPGGYALVGVRTAVFDEVFTSELAAGAKQAVILGAGYDSRALRFAPELAKAGAKVFEVDAPQTSRLKRQRVKDAPPGLVFVEVDFARDALGERLDAAGYSRTARTVFLWEGVCFYLPAEAVDAVLQFVRDASGAGSTIVFDFLHRGIVAGTDTSFAAQEQRAYVAKKGEPYLFGFDPPELEGFLAARGFTVDRAIHPPEMQARYLAHAPKDSHAHRLASFYSIAVARSSAPSEARK